MPHEMLGLIDGRDSRCIQCLLTPIEIRSNMSQFSNYQLHVHMGATVFFLFLTMVATAFVSGVALTLLFFFIYLLLLFAIPSVQLLLTVLGGSMVCILVFVAWEERNASDHIVSATGAARIENADHPKLMSMIRSLSQQADTPVPTLYITPTETPLSLTTGFRLRNARLIVSEGLITTLEPTELEAVVAHELAHIKNRDVTVMTLATLPISAADRVVTLLTGHTQGAKHGQPSRASYADALMTLGLLLVPPIWFCGHLLWASLSRARESAADRGAIGITGDPASLASALGRIDEKMANRPTADLRTVEITAFAIVESNRTDPVGVFPPIGRPLTNVFATHPATAARIERLQKLTKEERN